MNDPLYRLAPAGLLLMLAAAGCGLLKKDPPPVPSAPPITIAAPPEVETKASMTLWAGADANPDRNQRPSPVLLRVYQLRADAAFQSSQFEPLFDDDKRVLGETFVTRDEFTLSPGEKRVLEVALARDTRFIGVIAAFRDIRDPSSEWRAVLPAPRKGLMVTVAGKRVSVSATE
jgi:type VI secretion system protein VasD